MKLHIAPAQHGAVWARLGIRTFWRQPLAFTGLFFIFMTSLSLCALIPLVGNFLALALIPAATLGLMAATREVELGKFPMPTILAVGLREGPVKRRHMLVLGVLYACGLIGVMMLTALVDGGAFARVYLMGGALDTETLMRPEFQNAVWLSAVLSAALGFVLACACIGALARRARDQELVFQRRGVPAQLARILSLWADVDVYFCRHLADHLAGVVHARG